MKICDKCLGTEQSIHQVHLPVEDSYYDLCDQHMQELMEFLTTKTKRKPVRQNTAKAA